MTGPATPAMLSAVVLGLTACSGSSPSAVPKFRDLYGEGPVRTLEGPAIVVLWRSDCAPCVVELAGIGELERAARPAPVIAAALEDDVTARDFLERRDIVPRHAWRVVGEPAKVLTDVGGPPPRLPLAFAVRRDGSLCRRHSGLLGTDRVREWVKQCS